MPAIEVSNLSFQYSATGPKVLRDLNLKVQEGESFGLLGPNGAGKTTLLSCICRQLQSFQGDIKLFSEDIRGIGSKILDIGFAPQELALFPTLSAFENLDFFASLAGKNKKEANERADWTLHFVGLFEKRHQRVEKFSGGMKRRLNLAVALLNQPKVLILDEPTVGVDPKTRNLIFEKIEELKAQGLGVIYTTHYMEEVERLCDNLAIVSDGRVLFNGPLAQLKKEQGLERLEDCYLRVVDKAAR